MSKPLILITNDDGFTAKGLSELIDAVSEFGELLVVAPDQPQSGMGHAITVNKPIRFEQTNYFKGINTYHCSGTPVDCIKAGMYLLKDKRPDLILSGINHGSNVSTNVLYSGTMSAAVEGALEGIPSIGFSLTDYSKDANFSASKKIVKNIVNQALKNKIEKGICLNVNIPDVSFDKIKGIKTCRQGKAFWDDTFDERVDPLGKKYYWLTGSFVDHEKTQDTDVYHLKNNYVTIVPIQFDMTAYNQIDGINKWNLKK
jgi:5'-nucleotidase